MRLTGNFEKKFKKNRKFFFSIFSFLRAFVVSSCRKSGFRVFLSLRYGADLGRSRLVSYNSGQLKRGWFETNTGCSKVPHNIARAQLKYKFPYITRPLFQEGYSCALTFFSKSKFYSKLPVHVSRKYGVDYDHFLINSLGKLLYMLGFFVWKFLNHASVSANELENMN